MDFAGTVEAVGEGVTEFSVGDEVYGCAGGLADLKGALAEYMVVDTKLIAPKPKTLSMRQAAALPLVAITAYEGLERVGTLKDKNILVHGGTGGVGHVAVQLAKHHGANVFSTISKDAQADIVKSYGATPINYKSENVEDYVAKHTGGNGFMLIQMLHDYKRETHGAILRDIAAIVDAGALTPLLDETEFNLADVGKAYARLSSGAATGKVVVEI